MTTLGTAHAQHLLRISDLRPSQLTELLDIADALREHPGQLEGVAVAYGGDGNNVAHSLLEQ